MIGTKPLILIDGSSYLYRAFHALPPLTNTRGQPTGAVKGVINMLKKLQKDYPDGDMVVVFDAKGKTFRDAIYPDYKANRPLMPDDLRSQIAPIHAIIHAMGLPLVAIEGVEADDVIGTLADGAARSGRKVIISTGDKDMAQLVSDKVTLINTMSDEVLDVAGVTQKFGLPPSRIIDFLALMGDKVDNIPGVPGVGQKTAVTLLQSLGGLADIYQRLDEVAGLSLRGGQAVMEKLKANRDMAFLSYRLATIKCDVDVADVRFDTAQADNNTLLALFKELEFKSWVAELEAAGGEGLAKAVNQDKTCCHVVLTEKALHPWLNKLNNADLFAFDTETTSINAMAATLVGVSFSLSAGEGVYVPCGHDYLNAPKQIERRRLLALLKPLLEDEHKIKLGQNLKYDKSVLANYEINLRGIGFDTMLESYCLNSTAGRHDMDTLAKIHLDYKTTHFEDIAGKGAKQLSFNQIDIDIAAPYAAEDADITLRLHQTLLPQLQEQRGPLRVFETLEMPLLSVLSKVERNGTLVDVSLLGQQSNALKARLEKLQADAYQVAGEAFNLSSPKQLGVILYDKLQIPVIKKTPKGAPSTSEDVLQELARDYALPKLLLEYRVLSKLKTTYTDKLPKMINPATGRIHTSYHQAVTATGRLSSSDPNLQNIPVRTEQGRRVRKAFIAPSGYKIVAADYSQIELRIIAHLSQDESLLAAFSAGQDVHQATAAEVFDVALEAVTADQRRSAKAINFGLMYGMSAFGLAKQLQINRVKAQCYIDLYFARYPGIKSYMDTIRDQAARLGYVETLMGRRLYLPEITSRHAMRRQAAERTAINAPMQGTAADIIKCAMIAVDSWLTETGLDAKMIMQVHDELVLEVGEADLDIVIEGVRARMSSAMALDVALCVDVGVGDNWDEAH